MPNEKIAVIRGMETLLKGVATYLQKLISSAMANEISKKYAIVIGLCAGIGKSGAQSQVWEYPVSTLVQTSSLTSFAIFAGYLMRMQVHPTYSVLAVLCSRKDLNHSYAIGKAEITTMPTITK